MPEYPHQDGDFTVLGPEIFASADGAVICWKGENYVRQEPVKRALDELGVPGPDYPAPVANAVEILRESLRASARTNHDSRAEEAQ